MVTKFLAGFIITYNRVNILPDTVEKILAQSFPPEKLLIVDNSEGTETEEWVKTVPHLPLQYYRVGYNSGPAGGAAIGLQKLAEEGYKWIYWGDDNDPPLYRYSFEVLQNLVVTNRSLNIGSVGVVGQYFRETTGLFTRVPDKDLTSNMDSPLFVQTIAGGQSKWVCSAAILEGVCANEDLFFGFEELDVDIHLLKKGYCLLVDKHHYWEHRQLHNRTGNFSQRTPIDGSKLQREYYSFRNLLIVFSSHRLYGAVLVLLARTLLKLVKTGLKNPKLGLGLGKVLYMALVHINTNRLGKQTVVK
jgi:glycosyltransferase involved in cell wall biosynthesis